MILRLLLIIAVIVIPYYCGKFVESKIYKEKSLESYLDLWMWGIAYLSLSFFGLFCLYAVGYFIIFGI